jgi:hypothetical protein
VKAKLLLAVLLAAVMLAGTAHAGYISMLGEDGQVWNLDTSSRLASKAVKFPDPGGSAEEQYSPNALGVSGGSYFYTNYNVSGADTLYRDGTPLYTIRGLGDWNIANGDAFGSYFHFVDRYTGNFYTISNIFGDPGTQSMTSAYVGGSNTMGDIAINGQKAYLSYDNALATFNTNDPYNFTSVSEIRFVGLGFDGDSLYGVRRAGDNNFDLYSINTDTLAATLLGDITGLDTAGGAVAGKYEITDAARAVPIPAAAWLFGSGLVGLAALKRKVLKR